MKKALTFALAAALSATSLTGFAYAQTTSSTTTMAAPMTDDMVSVVVISDQLKEDSQTQIPESYKNATPDAMAAAQAEVQGDAALMDILVKKNVQLENVVGVQTAATGGKVVYVK